MVAIFLLGLALAVAPPAGPGCAAAQAADAAPSASDTTLLEAAVADLSGRRTHLAIPKLAELAAGDDAAARAFAELAAAIVAGTFDGDPVTATSGATASLPQSVAHRARVVLLSRAGELAAARGDAAHISRCADAVRTIAREAADESLEWEADLLAGRAEALRLDMPAARARLDRLTSVADRLIVARANLALGEIFESVSDSPAALDRFLDAAGAFRDADAVEDECVALVSASRATLSGGDLREGIAHAARSAELAARFGWIEREFSARQWGAMLRVGVGEVDVAIEEYRRLEAFAIEKGRRSWQATVLRDLGFAEFSRGDLDASRDRLDEALVLCEEIGDLDGAAHCHLRLALLAANLDDPATVERHADALLDSHRDTEWSQVEIQLLLMRADARNELGDRDAALADASLALRLGGERSDPECVADALRVRAIVHADLGDHDAALRDARESVRVASEAQLPSAIATGGILTAQLLLDGNDLDRAEAELEAAALAAAALEGTIRWAPAQPGFIAVIRTEIALARNDLDGAETAIAVAAEIAERNEDPEIALHVASWRAKIARARADLAPDVSTKLDCMTTVEHEATRLLDLATAAGAEPHRVIALGLLAGCALAHDDVALARSLVDEGLAGLESFAGSATSAALGVETASRSRATHAGLYSIAQDIVAHDVVRSRERGATDAETAALIEAGFARVAAFEGRALVEGITEHHAGRRTRESIALRREIAARIEEQERHLRRATAALGNDDTTTAAAERDAARVLTDRIEGLREALRTLEPRRTALFRPPQVTAAQLRATGCIGPDTLLVTYVRGIEKLYAYVIGPTSADLVDLGELATIHALGDEFMATISEPKALGSVREVAGTGRALARAIFEPALACANSAPRKVVVVPSGPVATIPFEALVLAGDPTTATSFADLTFALDRFEVRYAPSAAVLLERASAPRRERADSALVFADSGTGLDLPPLSKATAEAELVASRFRSVDRHLDSKATVTALAADLRRYRVLHFASHALAMATPNFPAGLLLRDDGGASHSFSIGEVLGLDLDADLVVLSACSTSHGEARPGEGVESLARAFLFAGARCVVASLFPLSDAAAMPTIDTFYSEWLTHGDAAAALREAKLRLRRTDSKLDSSALRGVGSVRSTPRAIPSSHPFVWAPLIAIG